MPKLIYLMGAGRSGTTAIATFLGGHPKIQPLGEMHQFYDHLGDGLLCSCGEKLESCSFWSKVLKDLPSNIVENPASIQKFSDRLEYHSSIPKHLSRRIKKSDLETYNLYQEKLIAAISQKSNALYFLDSAKYIGRNLSLRRNKQISLKTIYVVRDVRGVINSFSKNVQSSRTPLSTIFYYLAVNFVASMVYFFTPKEGVLKIKYEDFMHKPEIELNRIGDFLNLDLQAIKDKIKNKEEFEIGHIIGGNRLKTNKSIRFKYDERWREQQSRLKQITYFLLASPIMILNRYKI